MIAEILVVKKGERRRNASGVYIGHGDAALRQDDQALVG